MRFDNLMDKSFIDSLEQVVLGFGSETITHRELVTKIGVANMAAARRLNKILRDNGIKSLARLDTVGAKALMRIHGVGNATMWVAMKVLDHNGYSVERWWGWTDGVKHTKFSSYRDSVRERYSTRRLAAKRGGKKVTR